MAYDIFVVIYGPVITVRFGGNGKHMCLHARNDPTCATGFIIASTVIEQFNTTGFGGCIGFGGIPPHG
jgi:hypothetical protein